VKWKNPVLAGSGHRTENPLSPGLLDSKSKRREHRHLRTNNEKGVELFLARGARKDGRKLDLSLHYKIPLL
jgi:hypothetical protein